MLVVKHKGNFRHTKGFFKRMSHLEIQSVLEKYGQIGVERLAAMTPVDSGKTASCWSYEVNSGDGTYSISFNNSNINKGVNIAIIIQYGHGTATGGYVQGTDYINPPMQEVFNELAESVWREVTDK